MPCDGNKCKMVPLLGKTVQQLLNDLSIELPRGPAAPLLGIYTNRIKNRCSDKHVYSYIHSGTTHNSQKGGNNPMLIN